jgi:hypothetical protein
MGLSGQVEAAVSEAVKTTQSLVKRILDRSWRAAKEQSIQ